MTTKEKFRTIDDRQVDVDMMHRTGDYAYSRERDLGAEVLAAPYRGDRLSMIFFLPEKAEDFSSMEIKFGSFDFASFKPGRKMKVEVAVPKFTLKTTHKLDEPLQSTVGMRSMYDAGKADFSKMSQRGKDLYVSAVIQKAFVEVNEEGTEAAAATGAIMMTRMAMISPQFRLNRPFLFVIRDDLTGMILFAGKVTDPNQN
jgi:serpin B